ncbi:transposase [Mycoavidus sp. HKI]|nr:transposase [Mycoavidus sp. HKI]UAW64813.1 transposase [Mycoavidus sp. HKI]
MSKPLPELAHGLFGTLYADKGDIQEVSFGANISTLVKLIEKGKL